MAKQNKDKKKKKIIIYSATGAGVVIVAGAIGAGAGIAVHNRTQHDKEVQEGNNFLDKITKNVTASQKTPIMAQNKSMTFQVVEPEDVAKARELGLKAHAVTVKTDANSLLALAKTKQAKLIAAGDDLFTISEINDQGEVEVTSTGKEGSADIIMAVNKASKTVKLNVFETGEVDANNQPIREAMPLSVVPNFDFNEDEDLDKKGLNPLPHAGEPQTMKIKNPRQWAHLRVGVLNNDGTLDTSDQKATLKVNYQAGKIEILPKLAGTLKIGIFADNANRTDEGKKPAATVELVVQPKMDISVSSGSGSGSTINVEPKIGEVSVIQIDDSDKYINLKVSSSNPDVLKIMPSTIPVVEFDTSPEVAIVNLAALQPGTADLIITADNANQKVIPFTVPSRIDAYLDDVVTGFITGQTYAINVDNLADLVHIKVKSSNEKVLAIKNITTKKDSNAGTITIEGIAPGTASVLITADNITEEQNIEFTVANDAKLALLDIDKENPTFNNKPRVGEPQVIKIGDPVDLVNLGAQSDHSEIVGVTVDQTAGLIRIVPLAEGTAEITIRADNSTSEKHLTITSRAKDNVIIDNEAELNKNPRIGETLDVKITNYVGIIKPNVVSSDENVATIKSDDQGNLLITPINPGVATLIITGDNINEKAVDFEVPDRVVISVDETTPQGLKIGDEVEIRVPEYKNLVAPKANSSDSGIVAIESAFDQDGTIKIRALKAGIAQITITAANMAAPKVVTLQIAEPIKIGPPTEHINLTPEVGESQSIILPNFNRLVNPKVISEPVNALKTEINQDTQTVNFKPLVSGKIKVTISADNSEQDYQFELDVKAKHDLSFENQAPATLKIGQTTEVIIRDFPRLNLINPQVESSNQKVAGISNLDQDGKFTLTALGQGTTTITISGDNINPQTFTLTVEERINPTLIQTREGLVLSDERKTTTFTVLNYQDLVDPVAIPTDSSIIAVDDSALKTSGLVRVTALANGIASVEIKSKNTKDIQRANFRVLPQIDLEIDPSEIKDEQKVNLNQMLQVKNSQASKNIRVVGDAINKGLISASVDQATGEVNINPLKAGTANFSVESDNSNLVSPTTFSWTIKPPAEDTEKTNLSKSTWMKTTAMPSSLRFGESAAIEVYNYIKDGLILTYYMPEEDKRSLTILSDGDDLVDVQKTYDEKNYLINFTLTAEKTGTANLKVVAENMLPKSFTMTVEAKHDYEHQFNSANLYVGNLIYLGLKDSDFVNLVINSTNRAVLEPKKAADGQWYLVARTKGTVKVDINADNMAMPRSFDFNVEEKIDFAIPSFNGDVKHNQKTAIKLGRTDDLINPNISSTNPDLAEVTLIERDGWYYVIVDSKNTTGTANLLLTADNIRDFNFKVQITSLAKEDFLGMSDNFIATTKGIYDQQGNLAAPNALGNLQEEEILAMSGNIIATTRGVYNARGRQLSPYILKDLTKSDLLGLSDNVIATTKGIFNQNGVQIAKNELKIYSSETILGVKGSMVVTTEGLFNDEGKLVSAKGVKFTKTDILAVSDSLVVTTKGVFRTSGSFLFLPELYYYSGKLRGLTAEDIILVGSSAVVTTKGIYNTQDQQIIYRELNHPSKENIWGLSDKIIVTDKGVYETASSWLGYSIPIKPLRGLQKEQYFAQSNTLIATKLGVFTYNGTQIGGDTLVGLNRDDILAISDNIVVTTKGVFNINGKQIGNDHLIGLTQAEIIAVKNNLLVTTKGIYADDGTPIGGNALIGLRKEQVYGVSNNFVITAYGSWTSKNKKIL